MDVQFTQTPFKHSKSKKSNAKYLVKQSTLQLYEIYSNQSFISSALSVYLKVLDLTSLICLNQVNCGKDIVDISDILNNNLILGMKIKHNNMVAAFAYLITKFLNEGADSLAYYLNMIKTIATQKSVNINQQSTTQLILACQNIKSLILFSSSPISQKAESLVERTLSSLGSIMQWNQVKYDGQQYNREQLDVEQSFFHTCLKMLKICKLRRRNFSYKQLLANYFQYVENRKVIPTLDICKLTLHAVSINEQIINQQSSNIEQSVDKNDEEVTGFIVRKCFHFLREHYQKTNFFVEDHVLIQTINKCLTSQPYCLNSKTILVIFQSLLIIHKLQLVTNTYQWKQIALELENQNMKINDSQVSIIKVCKFVSSCHLFLQTVINYLSLPLPEKSEQQRQLQFDIQNFKKYMKKLIPKLMVFPDHELMNIWNHIINNLNTIKQQVIRKFQRKHTVMHRSWILDWSFCAQVQQNIITNAQHKKACDNLYRKLEKSNIYILIGRQYLLPEQDSFTSKFIIDRPSQNPSTREITKLCRQADGLVEQEKMFIYWDQLISIGASLLQICGDTRSIVRVSSVLKQLIKCKNMVFFAHGSQQKPTCGKYYKMNGLYNLLISFIKPTQMNIQDWQQNQILTCYLNEQHLNENSKQVKNKIAISNLRMQRHRVKSQLIFYIFKQFMTLIIQSSVFSTKHINHLLLCQNLTSTSAQSNKCIVPPYYQLFAYSIAIVPLILSQLTLEHRDFIAKLITQIVQTNDELLLNNIRHVYHKSVGNLLQDYTHSTNNSRNNENISTQKKQSIFKKKMILINYLQFYGSLYPNSLSLQQQQKSRQSNSQHNKESNTFSDTNSKFETMTIKKLNYRRSSVYMRQALQQLEFSSFENIHSEQQGKGNSQLNRAYAKILYIDFMYWVIHYCNLKQLAEIGSLGKDILEKWLDGKVLEQFLVNVIRMCRNIIANKENIGNHVNQCIELISQCCNKLIYLSCRSATSKIISNTKNNEKSNVSQDKQDAQQSNVYATMNNVSYEKINIEFQIQEASIHISRINMVLLPFSKLLQQAMFQVDQVKNKQNNIKNCFNYFMKKNWNDHHHTKHDINALEQVGVVKNPHRLITCFNNLIGFAYNIGHHYYLEQKNINISYDEVYNANNMEETNVLNILCAFKLMFMNKIFGVWMCYHEFEQMVFMGYLPKFEYKVKEIQQNINNYQQQYSKTDKKTLNNKKVDITDKHGQTLQFTLILLTKLYLSLVTPENQRQLFQTMKSNSHSYNTCIYVIHLLQSITHMNPHKTVMRTISGYIWTRNCLNEAALLKYEQPVMPITSSTMQSLQNKMNIETKIKAIWEYSSSQIQHSLLSMTVSRLLECLILHGQLSEFRSILKLSLIYFIRSRNTLGILLSLRSYLTRTKHIHFSSLTSTNFQENSSANSSQHPLAQHLSKLDMLSICDSMTRIFSTLHPISFNIKTFDKYCKLVLGTGNRRRTSISFHISIESITNMLMQSLEKCGRKGAELFSMLGEHACKALGLREQYIVYKKYSKLFNNCKYEHESTWEIKGIKDYQVHQHFTNRFLSFCQHIESKISQKHPISSQQLQFCFIEEIRNTIPFSYYYATVIENMLSNTIQQALDDKIILQLSILALDHSYSYKKMVENVESLGANTHVGDEHGYNHVQGIKKANNKYDFFVSQYLNKHIKKLDYLLSSHLKYPLTIIYPLGDKIYILTISSPLLVLHIDRAQFDDYIITVDTLIANNSKLLNNKNIDHKQWWKSRDRVDRSIAKIVNQINIPLWDIQIMQNHYANLLTEKQLKLYKLIESVMRYCGNDNKKIKNILTHSNINLNDNVIDETITKISQMLKIGEFPTKSKQFENENLLLLTYPSYTLFPFQANFHLRQRAVYRIPSIQYLIEQNQKGLSCKLININLLNYLVNSGNDLPETQKSFYKIKESYPFWKGVVGRKPAFKQYFSLLQHDAFLFMGHGAGSQHIRDKQFYGKNIQSFIMLFGCNSASITQGKCEPNGIAHSHLLNGAPALLGCLWEVTDKDTDKMTQNMFKAITHHPQNLSRILTLAKKKCKHQCLNGGAIVMFGIPTYVHIN